MNVAIVADWLPVFAGAEHVIAELHTLFPEAPIFTTVARTSALGPLETADIRTSSLQKYYKLTGKHQWLLPLMVEAVEAMDLRGYDTIISSSHAVSKGIVPPSTSRHICYCHTPMRYAWEMEQQYLDDFRVPKSLRRTARRVLNRMRRWDMTTAKRVDLFIANSTTTQERIKRIYNRESTVIHPPVSDRFFQETETDGVTQDYYLTVGRLVPYKRTDLLIEAANRLKIPLKVAGSGRDFEHLQSLAGDTVEMLGYVPDDDLPALYRNAKAFLFAPFEDAGVVPLEAQASGTPVIAYGKGGVLDTVKDMETGLYFADQTVESVMDAITRFEEMQWNRESIREHAQQYSSERFREKVLEVI